jgi:hypothetical protein
MRQNGPLSRVPKTFISGPGHCKCISALIIFITMPVILKFSIYVGPRGGCNGKFDDKHIFG